MFYRNEKFNITNVCGLLKVIDNSKIKIKFLYHVLSVEAPKYVKNGMGNPKLMSNVIAQIKIPVPSLDVQEKIANILDRFSTAMQELIKNLSRELELRKKQYIYYREKLLTFGDEGKFISLGDLCNISVGGDVPKKAWSKEKNEKYSIPIISNGTGQNAIYGYTDKAKITCPAVTVAARGTNNRLRRI